jgi:integrase/recombinase XerC
MHLSEALEGFATAITGEVGTSTVNWYRSNLRPLVEAFGEMHVEEITTEDLRRWRADLVTSQLTHWTLFNRIRATRRLFSWLTIEGYIQANPADRLRRPPMPQEPPKAIRPNDLARIITQAHTEALDGCPWAARDLAIVLFLADTGCRVGGLAGLRLEDLDLRNQRAIVREKGSTARLVYFDTATQIALRRWLELRPAAAVGTVFIGRRRNQPLEKSVVLRTLQRLGARAGVTGRCNPHSFRHAFALRLLQNGADLGTVSQLLGHVDINVTHDFYARWTTTQLAERHHKFSRLSVPLP